VPRVGTSTPPSTEFDISSGNAGGLFTEHLLIRRPRPGRARVVCSLRATGDRRPREGIVRGFDRPGRESPSGSPSRVRRLFVSPERERGQVVIISAWFCLVSVVFVGRVFLIATTPGTRRR